MLHNGKCSIHFVKCGIRPHGFTGLDVVGDPDNGVFVFLGLSQYGEWHFEFGHVLGSNALSLVCGCHLCPHRWQT
jgi:hypothetical protein